MRNRRDLAARWRRAGSIGDWPDACAPSLIAGPDGEGVWQDGRVAFGHRRLSIIDLTEASGQPMRTPDGTGVLVYNGEIYNHRELRRDLEREGVQFGGLGRYRGSPPGAPPLGSRPKRRSPQRDVRFAYFDTRNGALWLGRTGSASSRSSSPILASSSSLRRKPRRFSLIHAWRAGRSLSVGPMAFRRGARVAANAVRGNRRARSRLVVESDASGIEKRRILSPSLPLTSIALSPLRPKIRRNSSANFATACNKRDPAPVERCSPRRHVQWRRRFKLIAAYAKNQIPGIEGYVADVQWPTGEGDQAARVGRHLGIPIRHIVVDQARFLSLWPYTVWHSDNPIAPPERTALLAVVQACRDDGMKVLLTGEGSDELFGGYPWQERTYNNWRRLAHGGSISFPIAT